ncbi:MAG: 4-carboxymuconolactone decarboxylase [Deltaproteobacteria bacterium]|mgnify:CR=1 FL=1|nr:MAG: 4-carboxymuconolactone decarboxylase [Deltaproteobacteria bacterium]
MSEDLKKRTAETAALYFKDVEGEVPYRIWHSFDPELAKEFSLFITGSIYSREKLPHPTRQMVAVASLAALGAVEELSLHLQAALNVGVSPKELAEVIFQVGVYTGVPAMNRALVTLREVLKLKGLWPPDRG